jgi:hypothetical protein
MRFPIIFGALTQPVLPWRRFRKVFEEAGHPTWEVAKWYAVYIKERRKWYESILAEFEQRDRTAVEELHDSESWVNPDEFPKLYGE